MEDIKKVSMEKKLIGNEKDIVIIGAGITGLPIGLNFCKKGYNVTILEKNPFVGGIATSIKNKEGYTMDIGPHYITLPRNSSITNEIYDIVGKENIEELHNGIRNDRQVYFQGKLWNRFPSIAEYIKKLNKVTLLNFSFNFLICKFKKNIGMYNYSNVKDYLISNYGEFLYKKWFIPYYENLYGDNIPSIDFVKNQFPPIKILNLFSLYKNSINSENIKKNKNDNKFFNCCFKGGMISLISGYGKKIESLGGNIITNVTINTIEHSNNKKIIYTVNNVKKTLNPNVIVYALPLNIASQWFPEKIKISQGEILNCIMVFLFVNSKKVFNNWIIDFYDKKSIIWRISQPTYLTKSVAPENKSIITIELRVKDNHNLWKLDNSKIIFHVKEELKKIKLFDITKIEDFKIIKLKNLYPSNPEFINNKIIKEIIEKNSGEYAAGTEIDFGTSSESSLENDTPRLGGVFRAISHAQMISDKITEKD